jgi:predicted Zn finger-like uncharacterized protein
MFTVCPKCALTLVVTAADLRVAQGYVRCGRCSNVFNALARLSEDRQAAAAAAQAQAPPEGAPHPLQASKPAATSPQRPETSGTFRTRTTQDPSTTGRTRIEDLSAPEKPRQQADTSSTSAVRKAAQPAPSGQDARTSQAMPPPPGPDAHASHAMHPSEPKRYDDDSIPEEDLEFNPDATDLNKVFVEQPPSPQFTAATGTFKAIRLEAKDSARTDERVAPEGEQFDPTDTQVDVDIDPDLLASMAQLTSNRLQRLNPTAPEPSPSFSAFGQPRPATAPPPAAAKPTNPSSSTSATSSVKLAAPPGQDARASHAKHPASPKSTPPAKQPMLLQPPMEQPPQTPAPMRLAERAKARAADSKLKSNASHPATETTQAIRAAIAPRKRTPLSELGQTGRQEEPTSFFAGTWTAASVLLLLVLTIQVVHHYRHDLAANATLNGPLTSIYAVLGIPLVPRWDLGAYEVRQLGASTAADAPGRITVRASVKNGAHQAQPLPLLRVTLQDRFGNRIASRDVSPQSYLPRAIPRSSLLSAGQRIDAEMTFVDPGSNAVGFEIDACLPAPGDGISCANDVAR